MSQAPANQTRVPSYTVYFGIHVSIWWIQIIQIPKSLEHLVQVPGLPLITYEYELIPNETVKSVLPKVTKCVAMPSLKATRCLDQNCGPIFCSLWTKVHRIKFACAGVSIVCNAIFRLAISCCVPDIFAIKSQSCPKWCFWAAKYQG